MAKEESGEKWPTAADIARHNAAISAQIAAKQELKGKYQSVQDSANGIIGAINGYVEQLKSADKMLEKVWVGGPVGDGKLVSEDCATLNSIVSILQEVISACSTQMGILDQEIAYLQTQYW